MANTYSDLTGSYVASNYRQIPGTQSTGTIGIRPLNFYTVAISGAATNYTYANSTYAQAVLGCMRASELFYAGTPANGAFVIAIASDTANAQDTNTDGTYTIAEQLKQSIDAYTGGTSTVYALNMTPASIGYTGSATGTFVF